jgi:hypothetical protein
MYGSYRTFELDAEAHSTMSGSRRLAAVATLLAAGVSTSTAAAGAPSAGVLRIVAIGAHDRVSLVLEMTGQVGHAFLSRVDPTTVVVDAGPIAAPVTAQELTADPALPCIAAASVQGSRDSAGQSIARVRVTLRDSCAGTVRVAGRRVYVDATRKEPNPLPAAPSVEASITTATTPAPGRNAASSRPLTAPARSTTASDERQPSALPAPVVNDGPRGTGYARLELDTRRRAQVLVQQADVRGLMALRDEVARRETEPGHQQSELLSRLTADLARSINEARAERLKLDRSAFEKLESATKKPQQ